MDSEGNTSEASVQIISKDTQAPADVALTVTTYDKTSITVNATGTDQGSGIISYAFQISQTENEEDFTTVETVASTENSCAYTYTGLTLGTRYYLRVIVTDIAGYSTVSEIVKRSTQDNGVTDTVLAEGIGKYVDYAPIYATYSSNRAYNGNSNQSLSTVTTLRWRILFANEDTLTLISNTTANAEFILSNYSGYNNGVKLLNDACYTMYSNSTYGAVGRSLDIEDIESVSSYPGATLNSIVASSTYCPNIFAQEKTGFVNTAYGTILDLSDQTDWVTGYTQANTLKGYETYYTYNMSTSYMSSIYVELFNSTYQNWLASRCASDSWNGVIFFFQMFYVKNSKVDAFSLFTSDTAMPGSGSYSIRPVVEIDLSKATIGRTGDGSLDYPYSIEAQ